LQSFATTQNQVQAGPKCDGGIFEFLKKKMLPRIQNLFAKPKTIIIIIFFFFFLSLGYSSAAAMKEIFLKIFFLGDFFSLFFRERKKTSYPTFLSFGGKKKRKKIKSLVRIIFLTSSNKSWGPHDLPSFFLPHTLNN
jgi:hypothetical protein